MVCPTQPEQVLETPLSDVSAFLVEQHYRSIGCNDWNTRKVQLLCAKFGDTPAIMAARLRITPSKFAERLRLNAWTKQDALILTMLEQAVDFTKGDIDPQPMVPQAPTPK